MKIERKLLSQCTLEDLKRIYPKNVRCEDEDGNTDCQLFLTNCCPYLSTINEEDDDCAYCWLVQAQTPEDIKATLDKFGDILVRLKVEENK